MNTLLAVVVASQDGLFSTGDARRCGYTTATLRTMQMQGGCVRIARGLYAVPVTDLSGDDIHRRLTMAMLIRYAGRAVASHHSALLLHDLPVHAVDLSQAQLTSVSGGNSRRCADHVVHLPVDSPSITAERWPTVPVALALVQTAMLAGAGTGVVSADAALNRGLVTRSDLVAARSLVGSRPSTRAAALMLALADGRSESPGESRLRIGLVVRGIRVIPQVVIHDDAGRFVARVDLLVDGTRIVIEFDGMVKYRGVGGEQALIDEKLREDRLRALGYWVIRVTWRDLGYPERIAARVRAAIAQSRAAA